MKSFCKWIVIFSLSLCLSIFAQPLKALENHLETSKHSHNNCQGGRSLPTLFFTFDTSAIVDGTGTYTASVVLPDNTIKTVSGTLGDGPVFIQIDKAPLGLYFTNLIVTGVSGNPEVGFFGTFPSVTVQNSTTGESVLLTLNFETIDLDNNPIITIGSQATNVYINENVPAL